MSPTNWDDTKDRTLLLQLLTLHPIQVSTADWERIARDWDNGNKPNSFRMHFAKLKTEGAAMMEGSDTSAGIKEQANVGTRELGKKAGKRRIREVEKVLVSEVRWI